MGYTREIRKSQSVSIKQVGLLIMLPVVFLILEILTVSDLPLSVIKPVRIVFTLISPILAILFYVFFSYSSQRVNLEDELNREIILFTIIVGILGIFFAISLNTRSVLVILALIGTNILDTNTAVFILFAVIAPLVEEFVKIYPVFILSRQILARNGKQRILRSPQIILLLAVISGGIFNFLETYWYSWNVGSISNVTNLADWKEINQQLLLRSINPLHITSTMISAIGIIITFQNTSSEVITRKNTGSFLSYFFIAVLLHAAWNGSLFIFEEDPFLFGLPLINIILLIISVVGFIGFHIAYRDLSFPNCEQCNNWHDPIVDHSENITLHHDFGRQLLLGNDPDIYKCSNCGTAKSSYQCTNCEVTEVFACSNCNYPLPVYARNCWKCNNPVTSIYSSLSEIESKPTHMFSIGLYSLFSILYLGQLLIVLAALSQTGELADQGISITLFFVISMALLAGLYLNYSPRYQLWGLTLSRFLFALMIILINLMFFAISVLFLNIGTVGPSLFLWICIMCYSYVVYRILRVPILMVK